MPPKTPTSAREITVRNAILGALLTTEYRRLVTKMERVALKRGEIVYRAEQGIEDVYFPENAVIAMVDTTEGGQTVEVGVIGKEGMVGINIFLGGITTPDKAVVQLAGDALRMKARDLRKELRFGSPLQRVLLHYTQVFMAVISQSIACSQYHTVEQRLARWILTMHDYATPEFLMSHAFIASMLGTRRSGISTFAARFRDKGLIHYRRGRIAVLDRQGLERKSCECYCFIREQYKELLANVPRLLSKTQSLPLRWQGLALAKAPPPRGRSRKAPKPAG